MADWSQIMDGAWNGATVVEHGFKHPGWWCNVINVDGRRMVVTMIPPHLKRYADVLRTSTKLGLYQGTCEMSGWHSGSLLEKRCSVFDRLTISIPYASEVVKWEVIFNESEPELPPDFVFDCPLFCPAPSDVPHLFNWDAQDSHALSHVLKDLYLEYTKHQEYLLTTYPTLFQIYAPVKEFITGKNIEVLVPPYDPKNPSSPGGPVVFLIKLDLPFNRIPSHLLPATRSEEDNSVLLRVEYTTPDNPVTASESFSISPSLQSILGDAGKMPPLSSGLDLAEYVRQVKELLSNMIYLLDNRIDKRRSYMDALIKHFRKGILEYDVIDCYTATLLIDFLDFNYLLEVALQEGFPDVQPVLTFRSVYHTSQLTPFSRKVDGYPWSPRWSSEEMIIRLQTYLREISPTFQRLSVVYGTALTARDDGVTPSIESTHTL